MRSRPAGPGLACLFSVLAVAMVAGCRTVPVHPPVSGARSWDVTRPELQGRDHFQLQGRVAVAAGKDGFSAALNWTQAGSVSQVWLEGPLGVGAMQITANGNNLSILNSHGEHLDAD